MDISVQGAMAARNRGDLDTALAMFQLLAQDPSLAEHHASTWVNIGAVYEEMGDGARCHAAFRHALALDPKNIAALSNLAASALGWNRPEEAARYLESALVLEGYGSDPIYAHVLNGCGTMCIQRGWNEKALAWLDKALACDPDCVPAHWNRSLVCLALGLWGEGWKEHEWRFKLKRTHPRTAPVSTMPKWEGESLEGKRLVVHCEQGWGDMVMWARLGPMLKARGATVIWESHEPLIPLFQLQPWADQVFRAGDPIPDHDVHAFLISAVRLLGMSPATDPSPFPYLKTYGSHRMGTDAARKTVGLVWRGRTEHGTNEKRSAPHEFAQAVVRDNPDVNWVSFQKDYDPPAGALDGRPYMGDFAQSAAAMRVCDLIVSIDSAPVHLAGAMNVPCLALIAHNAEWRWRPDLRLGKSRWYRSVEFAQQDAPDDWASLLPKIHARIAA